MPIKQLLIWRHADAEMPVLGQTDALRALTPKGEAQAKEMARWLQKHMPNNTLILTSPAVRAVQTVAALSQPAHVLDILSPETRDQDVLAYLAQSLSEHVMLVGHQPWIGQVLAALLGFPKGELSVKKGAVWWLRFDSDTLCYKVHAVQTPALLT